MTRTGKIHNLKHYILSPYFLVAIIVLAMIAAFPQLLARYQVEQSNNTVELLLPYGELLEHVQIRGGESFAVAEALKVFSEAGIGGLLMREQSVTVLEELGELQYFEGSELLASYRGGRGSGWVNTLGARGELFPGRFYLEIYEPELWQRALYYLTNKYEHVIVHLETAGQGSPGILSLPGNFDRWENEGLGFPRFAVEAAAAQDLNIYLQLAYWPGGNETNIPALVDSLGEMPAINGLLFRDSQLPGVPGSTAVLATELEKLAAPLVTVEFFDRQIPSLNRLVRSFEVKELFRLHAITRVEMEELSTQRIIQRFRLAAAERNNRLLLLRFGGEKMHGTAWLNYNAGIYAGVAEALRDAGFELGTPSPYSALPFSRLNIILLGAGVVAAAVLLLRRLGISPPAASAAGIGALLLTAALLGMGGSFGGFDSIELARKGLSLGAALIFPTLAVLLMMSYPGNRSTGQALRAFVLVSAISLAGACLLAALLTDLLYMVKLDQFSGVKLALSLPPLLLLLYFGFNKRQLEENEGTNNYLSPYIRFWGRLRRFLAEPLLVGSALAAVIVAVLLYIYISRTGNESLFVSDLELRFRLLLDEYLLVRPRTKEFLIGHPLMLLALYYGYRFRGGPLLPALGAIGQVSLVNSFAHLHTPLLATVIRTLWGLGLGVLIGLVVIAALNFLSGKFSPLDGQHGFKEE